ncbi:MAG: NAD(P)H-dependent oxidoreductase [Mariprofundaceae bacterium]|nr:NAD(P)H-dependent oxidoreductase [Mariprofundaceae bacterium]
MSLNILISYHSDYGNTAQMAKAIAAGAKAATECEITVKQAVDTELDDLTHADLIIFGTPVHMSCMAWQLKQLIDRAGKLWMENLLEGKVGGVFATGGGFGGGGGGVESTMVSLYSNFLEHGMVVIGFPKSLPGYADAGLQWGPYARCGNHEGMPQPITEAQLAAARSYGAHIAETAPHFLN